MIGRFQPFHKGHLLLAKQIFGDCEELIIAVGSAQFNYMFKEPFTAGERIVMIHESLMESSFDLCRCYIIPIENEENNATWFAHMRSMVPSFDVLYSGNEFVLNLIGKQIEIRSPVFIKREKYNGSYIRELMTKNDDWKKLVPTSVSTLIEQLRGVERVKMLQKMQTNGFYNMRRYPVTK